MGRSAILDGERGRFLAARRPCRHRRVAQLRKREWERKQARSPCLACAHIALTIACMSTPRAMPICAILHDPQSFWGTNRSDDEEATDDQDSIWRSSMVRQLPRASGCLVTGMIPGARRRPLRVSCPVADFKTKLQSTFVGPSFGPAGPAPKTLLTGFRNFN